MRFRIPAFIIVSLGAVLLTSCSSVPDFKPSRAVQEASSFEEALDICASYQIAPNKDDEGRQKLDLVVALTPWIRCFEETFRKFPLSRDNEELIMFFRELQGVHDSVNPAYAETVDGPAMNFTVRSVVKHLEDPAVLYSKEERIEIEHSMPQFAIYLAEKGRFGGNWENHAARVKEAQLERNFMDEKKIAYKEPKPVFSHAQDLYCKRYRKYKAQVYNIEELASYKKLLEQNVNQIVLAEKVAKRYESLKTDALKEGASLDAALVGIRKKSAKFHNGYCLQ